MQNDRLADQPGEQSASRVTRLSNTNICVQVNNWFINARRRLPREDAKKLIEDGQAPERAGTEDSADSDMPMGMDGNMRY